MSADESHPPTDFLRQIVADDVAAGRYGGRVVTRFPPEPNGYLHIGHAKAICLNFGIAEDFGGVCHLRFDDTNPETEETEYVRAMQEDIRWLGFDWGEHLYHASDYFERMYEAAETLVRKGLAYVDSASEEEIREARGTVHEPGTPTPDRDRPPEESLDLLRRMRAGEFEDGAYVLRARIDLASPNMLMRDPVLYRIRHATHYRTGDAWCIYPLYDFAHCIEDAVEGVTHSFCSLEFENNRALYDWVLEHAGFPEPRPHQYEFNRLNLEHTVVSKRKLLPLVRSGFLSGWDDPRLPTLAGLRRRGVPPEAIRRFVDEVGVAKANQRVDPARLDHAVRDTLNPVAPRVMAVLDPLEVVLTNYPEGEGETLEAPLFPRDVDREGSRPVPFGRTLHIERSDFSADPPKGFRRLVPGGEVRLRYAYVIRCEEVERGPDGEPVRLLCTYDPETRGGSTPDGRKVKGTIHWVDATGGLPAEVRRYDRLFVDPDPEDAAEGDLSTVVNRDSRVVHADARVEPWVAEAPEDTRFQLERTGYAWRDPAEGRGDRLVLHEIVPLKDGWKGGRGARAARAEEGVPSDPDGAGTGSPPEDPGRADRRGGTDDRAAATDAAAGTAPASTDRDDARAADPELAARYAHYRDELGLDPDVADLLGGDRATADFFDAARAVHDPGDVAGWMVNDLRGRLGDAGVAGLPFDGAALGRLAGLVADGTVSRRAARDVLDVMVEEGGDPADHVARMGLEQLSGTDALAPVVDEVLDAWPDKVAEYRGGRRALLGMFVGQVMKATGGAADPVAAKDLLRARLEGDG